MNAGKNASRPRWLLLAALLVGVAAVQCGKAQAAVVTSFEVKCEGSTLGKITIDIYKDVSNTDFWSIQIQGGFDKDKNACALKEGYNYRWLQAFKLNQSFLPWMEADKWYMDRTRKAAPDDKEVADGSPFYVNLRGPGYGHDPLGYSDEPRLFTTRDKPIDWIFETALVCAETPPDESDPKNKRTIHMIDSFTWGFSVDKEGKLTLKDIVHTGKVTDNLIGAFGADPDTKTFKDSWNLEHGCCCVPTPSAAILLASGVPILAGLAWRRRRRNERGP